MKRIILILLIALLVSSCKNKKSYPLLSLLFNNKITVILKATYASDRPLDYTEINNNQVFIDSIISGQEEINNSDVPPLSDLPFFLDIGEIRVSTKFPLSQLLEIDSQKKSEEFWDVLAPYRVVYCNAIYNTNLDLNNCIRNNGFLRYQFLMNGLGDVYPSIDVGSGIYLHGGIFFRSVFSGYARLGGNVYLGQFDGTRYAGADIIRYLSYDPELDTGTSSVLPSQLFPLHHITYPGTSDVFIPDEYIPTIIEFRFNLKENLMLHSFKDSASGEFFTFVGISDWKQNHQGQTNAGGNLLLRMRMYQSSMVSSLIIDGGTKTNRHYYAIYPINECSDGSCNRNELLPLSATPVRNGNDNVILNLMAGSYVLQCRYDDIYDGYPEKILSEIPFEITGRAMNVYINCSCGYSTATGC